MKMIVGSLVLSLCATTALAATCKETATDKKLAGAALNSFMTKCVRDACEPKAVDKNGKPLSGAAKASFMQKCQKDA